MSEFITPIIDRYMTHINYRTITLLMTIESSFIPFPSEIVVPPAWWKAAQWLLNPYLVIFFSTLWALLWAFVNYYLSLWLWRKIIYRLADTKRAHLMMIDKESIQKAEEYFRKKWKISTFIWRLIPAIRQLISIPAWLAKMNLWHFILYTCLWAGIWNLILFIAWYVLWQNREKVKEYNSLFTYIVFGIILIIIIYFIIKKLTKKKK